MKGKKQKGKDNKDMEIKKRTKNLRNSSPVRRQE